ncbi:MAG: hypothetical protein LC135_03180 [Phycisphaerae bacterium]|nr:hypothetical protein [Phycisphaerae bacterium]MCZ2398858.1 hypothetical protein [Phycisphaerae bacterium]
MTTRTQSEMPMQGRTDDPRIWYKPKDRGVTGRLVRSPITFGHTQLTIEWAEAQANKGEFEYAGAHIDHVVSAMTRCFTQECLREFDLLARVTQTEGKLIKVLVLRASASERPEKALKVHLVPYFESHQFACLSRFAERHRVLPGTPGGLLGWIGSQEDKVDAWEVDFPNKEGHDKWAGETLRMNALAIRLVEVLNDTSGERARRQKATRS